MVAVGLITAAYIVMYSRYFAYAHVVWLSKEYDNINGFTLDLLLIYIYLTKFKTLNG